MHREALPRLYMKIYTMKLLCNHGISQCAKIVKSPHGGCGKGSNGSIIYDTEACGSASS